MDEYFRGFIIAKHDEGLSVEEIAKQVPCSIRDVASTITFHKKLKESITYESINP